MSQLKETRKAGTRTLIAIAIIGVSVYIGFEPLFDKVGGGVPAQVLGASFGAIFMIVLTMYLLNKQTEIEQEKIDPLASKKNKEEQLHKTYVENAKKSPTGVGVTPTPLPWWTSTMADLHVSDWDHQIYIFFEKNR